MELTKNTVLITGGTSGIGFELAKQLLTLGNTVIVTGRDSARLEKTKELLPAVHTIQSDVSDVDGIQRLFSMIVAKFPEMNVLINNAGIMKTINLHEAGPIGPLTQEIEINLNGPIRMVHAFLGHLKGKPNAAIVNVSSGLAFVPFPISPVYSATKSALHSYTLSLRVQLKNTSVKVFELAPPATATELLKGSMESDDMKGIAVMSVVDMVKVAIQGFKNDQFEIRPGQSNLLKLMNRIAPQFILNQLSKPVERMLAKQ
jgi:uncharacterized oxidoreductase